MGIDPTSALALSTAGPAADPVPHPAAAVQSSPSAKASVSAEPAVPQARAVQVDAAFGESNLIIYRIVDKATGDLIQQIPPEQLLEIARSVRQLLQGASNAPSLDVTS
jgi:hypothetical protein